MFVLDMLFGCWHRNCSFPISANKAHANLPHAAQVTGTYVVCLDCGKEFPYDWEQMKIVPQGTEAAKVAPRAAAAAAGFQKIA